MPAEPSLKRYSCAKTTSGVHVYTLHSPRLTSGLSSAHLPIYSSAYQVFRDPLHYQPRLIEIDRLQNSYRNSYRMKGT